MRAECLSWLFWQMGSAPYLGGGFGHFYSFAPVKLEYPIDRFAMEVKRQLDVLDRHLASSQYMCGDDYTIADIAIWPWYGALVSNTVYEAAEFLGTRRVHQREPLDTADWQTRGREARQDGQQNLGRTGRATARAP